MGKFLNGLFVGIGIGLFIAPQTGEETRRLIMERVAALRKSRLSEDDQHFPIRAYPSPITTFSVQPAQPIAVYTSEPEEQVATPDQPIATSSSEPEEQDTTSVSLADTLSTLGNQNATSNNPAITDTAQTSGPTTNSRLVLGAHPDQQTPTETPGADTADTEKLPTLSSPANMPSRSTRRKTSTRTSNTSKTRGHSRS
jgi:hypothetical protein